MEEQKGPKILAAYTFKCGVPNVFDEAPIEL